MKKIFISPLFLSLVLFMTLVIAPNSFNIMPQPSKAASLPDMSVSSEKTLIFVSNQTKIAKLALKSIKTKKKDESLVELREK